MKNVKARWMSMLEPSQKNPNKYHPLLMVMQVYSNLVEVAKVELINPFVKISKPKT
jgi:hypothetical protein